MVDEGCARLPYLGKAHQAITLSADTTMNSKFIKAVTILLMVFLIRSSASASEKPNIVFILADDLGTGDG